ncbi:MAG: PIN domain-containing protein [Actinobacteria bacterium]|nr:PIN domain-containing protein [Actinomycetota bacterium]
MSEDAQPPRAVLDTDVIFSRVLYELFGRLAIEHEVLSLIWSDELLREAQRVLIDRKPLPPPSAERWVSYLRSAFPEGRVDLRALPVGVDLSSLTSDADDEHVCALAVAGDANLLVTFDHGYDRTTLRTHGVEIAEPDEFLSDLLNEQPSIARAVIETQAAVWGGGRSADELVDALARARVTRFAARLRTLLEA